MFGFSNSGFQEQTHTVARKDWENVLDSLYRQAINGHKVGLTLVSDTTRSNPEDVEGTNPGELTFRVKSSLPYKMHDKLRKFDSKHFHRIFEAYNDSKDKNDFYHLKSIGIGQEVMIFPLAQGLEKKALLILKFPVEQVILEKLLQQIKIELQRPELPPPKPGTAVTLQSALKPAPQADDKPSSEESN
jgi:hypothetical protein